MLLQPEDELKFKCGDCGRAYRHAGSLANHKKTHDVGIFECSICGKENSNALALKNHLRSHTSQKKYPCLECGKAFHRPSQLVIHERVHVSVRTKEHSVSEVDMESVTHEDQNEHTDCFLSSGISAQICCSDDVTSAACNTQTETDDMERPFKCDLCDKSYIHQGSLSNHTKTHQTGTFECAVCFKLFNNMAALYSHQRTHKSKSQVDSDIGFYTVTSLDQFLPQSQDLPVNFCHLCQVLFSCEEEFQDHIQIHNSSPLLHQNDGAAFESSTAFSESQLKQTSPFAIGHNGSFDLPNEQIPTNGNLYDFSHLDPASLNSTETGLSTFMPQTNNNTDRASAVDSEERPYKCDICFKTYRHYGSLVNHKRSHQVGNYQCSICGKSCPHLAAFKSHIRIHKTGHLRRQDSSELQTMDGQLQTSQENRQPIVGAEHQNASVLNVHLNQDSGQTFGDSADIKLLNCLSIQQQNFPSNIFNKSKGHLQVCAEKADNDLDFYGLDGNHLQNAAFLENASDESLNLTVADEQEEDDQDFYLCSVCGNRYTNVRDLKTHMRGHTQLHSPPLDSVSAPMSVSEQVKEEVLDNMIICCLCGESFSNSQELVNHQLQHSTNHLDNAQSCNYKCEVKNKNLICGSCGIFCTSLSHLESHKCTVEINHSTKNDEEIKERNNYADASFVEEERQFKCEECGRSYRHAGSLLNHKKSHKTGLFRCHVCQKSFYNLLALKNHQRSHFDIKRFQCDECGKAYRTQKQLLNHMRGHKKHEIETQVQTLVQMNESRSDGGTQSLSTNASQECHSKSTQEEMKESKATNGHPDSSDERPFACDQCGRTYRHAGSLVNHKNSHKTGEYLCSICNNSYTNQMALKNHLRTHFAFKRHSCPKCGKRFRSKKQLSIHICTHLKRRRKGLRFNKRTRISVNSEFSNKEERPFTCTICNRNYRHASSLLNHQNTHKTGHYNCTACSKHFTNPMALRNHRRIHTQKKKYVCLTCGKAFRVASVLYSHQKVHTRGGGHFSCPDCGMSFRGTSGLHRHQCPTGQKSGKADQHSGRRDKCFTCDLCGRSYRHAGSLLTHKKTHSESLHHCTLCLQTFPDPLALDAHSQMRRHSCPDCGKTFCLLSHLQSHMEVHDKDRTSVENGLSADSEQNMIKEEPPPLSHMKLDSGSKAHVCEYCGRTYRHAGSLLNHKNSHKTGRFSCSVCLKEFPNLMALKNHSRIHTEPKRYLCLECGKAFRVSSQLVCHRRIHTRERPFACSVCDRSFSSKSNLKHHEKMHRSGTQEQAFSTNANAFIDLDIDAYL